MPIALMCPNCSAGFSAKDEHAGRRTACPKCGQPMTIPGVPFARAVTASRRKSADEDDEDTPEPKRRRDEDDPPRQRRRDDEDDPRRRRRPDDEDDAPRSRRRSDDDEDRPRRRRRRGDTSPTRSGHSPVVMLCVVVGLLLVLLVSVMVAVVVWLTVTVPAITPSPSTDTPVQIRLANVGWVRSGMVLSQVEELMGPGEKADPDDVRTTAAGFPRLEDIRTRWEPKVRDGLVYRWKDGGDTLLVAFSSEPASGGRVVGILNRLGNVPAETVMLADRTPIAGAAGAIEISAATLTKEYAEDATAAAAKYDGKLVRVTGIVREVSPKWDFLKLVGHQATGRQLFVDCQFAAGKSMGANTVRVNQPATVIGTVKGFVRGDTLVVHEVKSAY